MLYKFISSCALIMILPAIGMNADQQKIEVLHQTFITPISGSYRPQEFRKYLSKDIYFKGMADLVGGSTKPIFQSLHIKDTEIKITKKIEPFFDFDKRNLFYTHSLTKKSLSYWSKTSKYIQIDLNDLNIVETNYNLINETDSTINPIVYTSTGQRYFIEEERLAVPIIGLVVPATFRIQYLYIPCDEKNNRPMRIFTLKNGIKTVNFTFCAFLFCLIANNIYKNF